MFKNLVKSFKKSRTLNVIKSYITFVPKRIRIVLSTLVTLFVLVFSTFFPFIESWYFFVIAIIFVSAISTYFAIFEGVDGVEWYMLFIVPIFFALTMYFTYTLFPARWLTRLPFIILFSLGYYAVLLTMNIFNVGVTKSIQLYRAAFSINYISQTFIVFLLSLVILSFRFPFFIAGILLFISAFMLSLQLFWSVNLESKLNKNLYLSSLVLSLIIIQIISLITFVPLEINIVALVLSGTYYSISGIIYHSLSERLFKNTVREYVFVLIFILLISLFTLSQ